MGTYVRVPIKFESLAKKQLKNLKKVTLLAHEKMHLATNSSERLDNSVGYFTNFTVDNVNYQ